MTSKTRSFRPSPALAISALALFVALTGSAFAAGVLGPNTVRSPQIVNGAVRNVDLHDGLIGASKISPDAVGSTAIAENAVGSSEVAPESLTGADLGNASVSSSEVQDESLGSNDLSSSSVGSSELQAGAVRASELGPILEVHNQTTINGGGNATVEVSCPAGTTVLSGGGLGGFYQVAIAGSFRANNGWHIDARSSANNATTLTAFAYCLVGGSSN
jgi:hypothetical protein